jgi:hypothetical protein
MRMSALIFLLIALAGLLVIACSDREHPAPSDASDDAGAVVFDAAPDAALDAQDDSAPSS